MSCHDCDRVGTILLIPLGSDYHVWKRVPAEGDKSGWTTFGVIDDEQDLDNLSLIIENAEK